MVSILKMDIKAALTYACMNIKKLAILLDKRPQFYDPTTPDYATSLLVKSLYNFKNILCNKPRKIFWVCLDSESRQLSLDSLLKKIRFAKPLAFYFGHIGNRYKRFLVDFFYYRFNFNHIAIISDAINYFFFQTGKSTFSVEKGYAGSMSILWTKI
jgi:hypothetical protein